MQYISNLFIGETSSWHIYEKKPEVYKYHIQAIGRKDDAEMVLDILKKDVANMEVWFLIDMCHMMF